MVPRGAAAGEGAGRRACRDAAQARRGPVRAEARRQRRGLHLGKFVRALPLCRLHRDRGGAGRHAEAGGRVRARAQPAQRLAVPLKMLGMLRGSLTERAFCAAARSAFSRDASASAASRRFRTSWSVSSEICARASELCHRDACQTAVCIQVSWLTGRGHLWDRFCSSLRTGASLLSFFSAPATKDLEWRPLRQTRRTFMG